MYLSSLMQMHLSPRMASMPERLPSDAVIRAWARLIRAQQAVLAAVEAELKTAGFPPLAWYDVLLELSRAQEGLRPFALEQELLLAQYNLSRLLDRLERAGYLERRACPEDGRGQIVAITAAGRALVKRIWPTYRAAIARHLGAKLSEDEASRLATLLGKLTNAKAGAQPNSKVVTPNTRSRRSEGIAPVYMRAVSNTGARPRSCASATASRLTLGTSRKTGLSPAPLSSAASTASAAARSSATSGPILRPVRHGRITPQAASLASRTSARPTWPGVSIQARRNAARGAGKTVASSASTAANGMSVSPTAPAGAGGAAMVPP